ncbi:MAG: helix-turn-helix domain-containing protein [Oscillospiraceae bacterium]|nr:helix-turn-helix domain-containing protein [Oscillospiraceae bacterium]
MNKDEIINNLITNINTECQKRNISSAELFRRSGVHKSVLDNLKRNSLPAIDIIVQISTYLGVSVDYLIGYK